MKIGRCRNGHDEFWAVLDPDLDRATPIQPHFSVWSGGASRGELGEGRLDRSAAVPLSSVTLLPPVVPTAKILCMGLNYRSHVQAFGKPMPTVPVVFLKAPSAVIGPYEDIRYPELSTELDFEIELAVVIGAASVHARGQGFSVLGFTVANDVSARDLQHAGQSGPDLYAGKSLDGTCPIGPWIVTADELPEHPDLELTLCVNDIMRQHDRTSSMHMTVPEVLHYLHARSSLVPGDVILTGTPAGVGSEDGRFLHVGDQVEARIERIGSLKNTIARTHRPTRHEHGSRDGSRVGSRQ
jgi:2-keto-4-pentenoate hydratase/2-oxohepta-3-ene-1,7-dioic acid hydratase in catechol pathway